MLPSSSTRWLILVTIPTILAQTLIDTNLTDTTHPLALTNTTTNTTTTPRLLLEIDNALDDYTKSGTYQILLCGAGHPNSKAARLQSLLPYIWRHLDPVLHDLSQGTASHHGFAALFKSNASIPAVASVFQKIQHGLPLPISADRAARLGRPTASPTFACMEQGDRFTAHLWAECLARNSPTSTTFAPLMTWGHTEIIFICPSFWSLPPAVGAASCPAVVGNRATPNNEALIRSMLGVVLHTLVNVYVPASLNYGNSPAQEVVNVQDAIELNTTQSLVNANNYALYAASVQAGCTNWPIVTQCEAEGTCAWSESQPGQ